MMGHTHTNVCAMTIWWRIMWLGCGTLVNSQALFHEAALEWKKYWNWAIEYCKWVDGSMNRGSIYNILSERHVYDTDNTRPWSSPQCSEIVYVGHTAPTETTITALSYVELIDYLHSFTLSTANKMSCFNRTIPITPVHIGEGLAGKAFQRACNAKSLLPPLFRSELHGESMGQSRVIYSSLKTIIGSWRCSTWNHGP